MSNKSQNKTQNKSQNKTQKIYKTNIKNDFYSFVNKKWINKTIIPKDEINQNHFTNLSRKIIRQLKNTVKKGDPKLWNMFKPKWIDDEIEKTIILLFKKLEEIKIENDFYKLLSFLISNGLGNIISLDIQQFIYNPKKRIIVIDAESQTFSPEYYKEHKYNKYITFYRKYLKACFSLFHINESNIVEIESTITGYFKHPSILRKVENVYFLMSNEESLQKCNFDWKKLLLHLNVKIPKKVVIQQPEYIKKMMLYFKNWNSEFFASFWKYKIIVTASNFHSKLYDLSFSFQNFVYNVQKKLSVSDRILTRVNFFENFKLNKLYHSTANCKKIVKVAVDMLIKRLQKNQWLSRETIKKGIEKIKKIKVYIGRKPKMDSKIDITYSEICLIIM